MTGDLTIRRARLRGREELTTIVVRDGRIARIDPGSDAPDADALTTGALKTDAGTPDGGVPALDAAGGLVTETFIDAHLHLCKVYTLDRVGEEALSAYTRPGMGAAMSAIEMAAAVKAQYAQDWIIENARRALLEGVKHGVLHVQAFADVDPVAGLEGVKALLALREELRGLVEVRVVAFPQDGLIRLPGAEQLVVEAVGLGVDVVGGIPWIEHTDVEAAEHVERMCALAAATGRRVAMLVDDAGDPSLRTSEMLAVAALRHGLEGKVVACHARAMADWPEPYFHRFTGLARRAGLAFVTDPHTGPVHLRVGELVAAGIPVALGQDDIADAYYPYGRHNMLEVAFLASHVLGAVTRAGMDQMLDMVTVRAAQVMGVDGHAIAVGAPANLAVHAASTVRDLLTEHAPPRWVIARGRIIAHTTTQTVIAMERDDG